jgi:hypothetical protein
MWAEVRFIVGVILFELSLCHGGGTFTWRIFDRIRGDTMSYREMRVWVIY